jgi:hypothetical protein
MPGDPTGANGHPRSYGAQRNRGRATRPAVIPPVVTTLLHSRRFAVSSNNGPATPSPARTLGARLSIGREGRNAARLVAGGLVLLFAFTVLYVAAFHAPRAKGLDVGVVGSAPVAARVQSRLDSADRGAFDVRAFASEQDARDALLDTDVHGVIVPGAGRDRIVVAQALGVAQTDTVVAALRGVAAASGAPAVVQDVRPLPAGDRRGLSPLFTVIGTLVPSLVFGVLLSVFGGALCARTRWSAVLAYALVAGPVVAFDVDVVVGALDGAFVGVAVVSGLLALSVAAAGHGLAHLGGAAGIGAAVLTIVLLGLSSSGGAVGYQFEPGLYGAVSQLLPPGAAVTAVRNVRYFDWAATVEPLVVLGGWALGGLVLGLLAERTGRAGRDLPAARRLDVAPRAAASA